MDFKKLQENAIATKEAIASKTEETKITLEKSFVDAMKSWEDAVIAIELEAKTDTTKTTEATQARVDFDKFKNELEQEFKDLLTVKEDEKDESSENTNSETNNLATEIIKPWQYTIEDLKTLKDKPWTELRTDPKYIVTIQHIIIDTGAKHNSISDEILTNGIYGRGTKAGIKTLQEYLKTTYTANLTPDGIAGPATLTALLEMDGDKTRLEKIIADHSSITPETPTPISQNTNKKWKWTGSTWWNKKDDEVITIKEANEEIPEKVIDDKFRELKKLRPGLPDKFLKEWAIGILNLKATATLWEFIYEKKTYYFDKKNNVSLTKSKIDKTWVTTKVDKVIDENIDAQTTVDNNIIKVNEKRIESWLNQYIHSNLISFEGEKNKMLCDEYYQKYIINLKNVKILTSKLPDWKTRINFLENWGYTKYFIDLMQKDFIKKWTNDLNYETINIAIKKDIISKIQKDIEQKEASKLQQRYFELEKYLEKTYFPINSLYSKQEQQNTFVQALFEDFDDQRLEFNRWDSIFDKVNKKIKFEFDSKGSKDKYGYGIMDINSKFTKDGKLDKEAVKKDIKSIIDIKIKKLYPTYQF